MQASAIPDIATHASKRLADADTPLIENAWYVAGRSAEFSRELRDRWILNRNVLCFRKEDGTPVAIDNRCAHRSFPLSKGHLEGDNVVCGYHGLTYDPNGACVRVPAMPGATPKIRIDSYPVVERAPLVWIWVGERDRADESLIPPYPPILAEGYAHVTGYVHLECNYVGLQENLHDLTHFSYLHSATVGTPEFAGARVTVTEDRGQVIAYRELLDSDPPPFWAKVMGVVGKRVNRSVEARFVSPALNWGLLTITDRDPAPGARAAFHVNMMHFMTPETQHTTHYYWFSVRDFAADAKEVSDLQGEGIRTTFLEDKDALEWISALRRQDPRKDFAEASFPSDRPGVQTRRELQRMAEAAGASERSTR